MHHSKYMLLPTAWKTFIYAPGNYPEVNMEGRQDLLNNLRGKNNHTPPPVFKRRSESFKWMVLAAVGIIILFLGALWVSLASWTPPPNSADYQNYQDYAKDLRAWNNFTKSGNLYGRIVMEVGTLTMIIAGIFGYLDPAVDTDEKKIFAAMLFLGTFLLVLLSVGLTEMSPYVGS